MEIDRKVLAVLGNFFFCRRRCFSGVGPVGYDSCIRDPSEVLLDLKIPHNLTWHGAYFTYVSCHSDCADFVN
jgi:hypothetical protein